ncbi:MAG: hypothetical protein ABI469_04590 [Gemmatimonadales bacterium]
MLKIIDDGENRFRLESATGVDVGWIRGHALGFRGLPTEKAVIEAAADSSRALEIALAREFMGHPVHDISTSRIRLQHDGAYEWVADGYRPLARILRPTSGQFPEKAFGIEFQVPSYATLHVTIACAQAVWRVLGPQLRIPAMAAASPPQPSRVFPFRRGPSLVTVPGGD